MSQNETPRSVPRWLWGAAAGIVVVVAVILVIVAPWDGSDGGSSSAAASSGGPAAAAAASAEQAGNVAKFSEPIPDTGTSHEFASAKSTDLSIDLASYGYTEQEYFLSGKANVYNWKPKGNFALTTTGSSNYTTRVIVRRPEHPKPGAHVVVELMNSSLNYSLPYFWMMWPQLVRNGDIYVGIDIQPNVFDALKRFDAKRYAPLAMPNPVPVAEQVKQKACGTVPADGKNYDPGLSKNYENGLAYDIITQLGRTLRASGDSGPLGTTPGRMYLAGYSRQAMYLTTYARFFARTPSSPGGDLWDGYLASGGSVDTGFGFPGGAGYIMGINQCAAPLPADDPQLKLPAIGTPIMNIHTQSDWGRSLGRPDSHPDTNTADDKFVDWEVPGASHLFAWEFDTLLSTQHDNQAFKHLRITKYLYSVPFAPTCSYPQLDATKNDPGGAAENNFPIQYVLDGAYAALDRWATTGQAPPSTPPLVVKKGKTPTVVLDRFGNAEGGLRTPYVEVPTATWEGASEPGFGALKDVFCALRGTVTPFTAQQLRALYPTREAYSSKVKAQVDTLVAQRFLTPQDGRRIVDEADQSFVPSTGDVPFAPPWIQKQG